MTVLGGLEVDGLGQVKLLHDDTRTEVKVLANDRDQLVGALVGGTVGLDEDGEGLSNTDGVRELDKDTTSQLGVDQRLGDPSGNVGSGTVDLGVVLSGEGTTTVGTPSTVGVDDDLTTGQTGVTLGTTDDEQTRGLQVVDSAVIKQVGGDDLLDDLLLELLADSLGVNVRSVLSGDDDGVNAKGLDSTVVVGVLDGDLGLGVRAQPGDSAIDTGLLHGGVQLVGQQKGQGQQLRSLIGSVAEHDTLVTGTKLLESLVVVQTLSNVGRLLLDGNENVAGLVVEALGGVIVANVLNGTTDDLLVVQMGLGGDLTKDHDHT